MFPVPHSVLRDLQGLIGPDGQTIIIPIAKGLQLATDGTTGDRSIDVTTPMLAVLGPYVQSIQAMTALEGKTTNFRFNVKFQGSTTGRTYNAATALFSNVSTVGEATQTAYLTPSDFGRVTRWALVCSNAAGTAVESGVVWVYLVCRLRA